MHKDDMRLCTGTRRNIHESAVRRTPDCVKLAFGKLGASPHDPAKDPVPARLTHAMGDVQVAGSNGVPGIDFGKRQDDRIVI